MMEPLKRSKDYSCEESESEKNFSFMNYLRGAHVHGFKFLARNGKAEKLFWYIVIISSFSCMAYCLYDLNNSDDSTIEIIDPGVPLHNIPFPAITICPETKAQKSMVNVMEAYHRIHFAPNEKFYNDNQLSNVEAISQVCDPHLFSEVKIKESQPTAGEEFNDLLEKMSIPLKDHLLFCKYRSEISDCTEHFKKVIIDDGICYTFNMQNLSDIFSANEYRYGESSKESDWDLENGYKDEKEFDVYPHRALQNTEFGFNVVLNLKTSELDHMCKGPVQGFKVQIHSPSEFPQMSNGAFRVSPNEEVQVGLEAEKISDMTEFDETCHNSESKPLKFFKKYSQSNCQSECKSNYVLEKCGCVKFSMIRDNETKVCTQHDTKCVVDSIVEFSTSYRFQSEFPCDCRPSCTNLKYKSDVTSAIFSFKQVFGAFNESLEKEFPQSIMSRLVVYFKDDHYTSRSLYDSTENDGTWLSKLSQIGGFFAFFMGISVISIVEIIYFMFACLFA